MKPITEELRQELIEFIMTAQASMNGTEPVDPEKFDIEKLTPLVFEIALASLTSEVRYGLISSVNPDTGDINIYIQAGGIVSINPDDVSEMEMIETEKLYTAPPVQLIPSQRIKGYAIGGYPKTNGEKARCEGKVDGWNECIAEMKRMNGIPE